MQDINDDIINAFKPLDECSICGADYDPDEGGIQGYFGIMPVTFCVWCYSSMLDMARIEFGLDEEDLYDD